MLAIIVMSLVSCGESPEITFTSPVDGQSFTGGDVLLIEGSITDDGLITSVSVSS